MVGRRRLELLTFPVSRDALTGTSANQFQDRSVGFPGLQFALSLPRLRQGWVGFLMHEQPRPAASGVWAMASLVLRDPGG